MSAVFMQLYYKRTNVPFQLCLKHTNLDKDQVSWDLSRVLNIYKIACALATEHTGIGQICTESTLAV